MGSVFGEIERMISTTQAGFKIAYNHVDPVEFGQVLGLMTTCYDGSVLAESIGYPGKTAQAIRIDYAYGREVCISPANNRFMRKTSNRCHHNFQGLTFGTEQDGDNKRRFILRAMPTANSPPR